MLWQKECCMCITLAMYKSAYGDLIHNIAYNVSICTVMLYCILDSVGTSGFVNKDP